MPVLRNPRHEKLSQLVATGIKPTEAYTSLGYSKAGAPQSANNLLKRTDVRERVNEIRSLAAQSSVEAVAFDQKRVLNRLDVLSRKAEELGQISATARCEELIGKHRAGGYKLGDYGAIGGLTGAAAGIERTIGITTNPPRKRALRLVAWRRFPMKRD